MTERINLKDWCFDAKLSEVGKILLKLETETERERVGWKHRFSRAILYRALKFSSTLRIFASKDFDMMNDIKVYGSDLWHLCLMAYSDFELYDDVYSCRQRCRYYPEGWCPYDHWLSMIDNRSHPRRTGFLNGIALDSFDKITEIIAGTMIMHSLHIPADKRMQGYVVTLDTSCDGYVFPWVLYPFSESYNVTGAIEGKETHRSLYLEKKTDTEEEFRVGLKRCLETQLQPVESGKTIKYGTDGVCAGSLKIGGLKYEFYN